jgi:hypothetical protein
MVKNDVAGFDNGLLFQIPEAETGTVGEIRQEDG